jgi:hypothetical protein
MLLREIIIIYYHTNYLYQLCRYCVYFFQTFVLREKYKETVQLTNGQKKKLMDKESRDML